METGNLEKLFERIRAARPNTPPLSDDEFAMLKAWLGAYRAPRKTLSQLRESDPESEWIGHLRFVLGYNEIHRTIVTGRASADTNAGTPQHWIVTEGQQPSMDHEFKVIVAATRELVQVLRTGRPLPNTQHAPSYYVISVLHQVGNLASLIAFWFTRDPKTDTNVRADKAGYHLYGFYRGRPDLRSAMLRLWSLFNELVVPRWQAARDGTQLPHFSDAELDDLEAAADELNRAAEPRHGQTATADLITTDDLAQLAIVDRKTLMNCLSKARKASQVGRHPPDPAVSSSGQRPDSYSYSAIRPWLLSTWPDKQMRFPPSYEEAKRILA